MLAATGANVAAAAVVVSLLSHGERDGLPATTSLPHSWSVHLFYPEREMEATLECVANSTFNRKPKKH